MLLHRNRRSVDQTYANIIHLPIDIERNRSLSLGFVGPCIFTHSNESTN